MNFFRLAFFASVLIATAGFTNQPMSERKAQELLPQAQDDLWKTFGACKVHLDAKKYTYSIELTPQVKAMEGKPFTISGFMLPLEAKDKFTHYLLSKRTPTCPFCPPGEPNEIVEVFSKVPVKWDEGIVAVSGTMKLTNDPDKGLFFQMRDGQMVSLKPYQSKDKLPVF